MMRFKMPTASCKWCNSWLFNEDIGRKYIQVKSGMKIQSKFICLKCENALIKENLRNVGRTGFKLAKDLEVGE